MFIIMFTIFLSSVSPDETSSSSKGLNLKQGIGLLVVWHIMAND